MSNNKNLNNLNTNEIENFIKEQINESKHISDLEGIEYEDIYVSIKNKYDIKKYYKLHNLTIKTGIKDLDKIVGGLEFGTLNTIAGFTGSGKTTLAVNIAYNALLAGFNVLYVSLEVSKEHIMYNMFSRHSLDIPNINGIKHNDIKKQRLSDEDYETLYKKVYPSFINLPGKLYVVDDSDIENKYGLDLTEIIKNINKLCLRETNKPISLLVVDHAQLLKYGSGAKSPMIEYAIINNFVAKLRKLSCCLDEDKHKCCVLLVSQVNREGAAKITKEKLFSKEHIAEASEVERSSNIIIGVNIFEDIRGKIAYQLLKSRDTKTMEKLGLTKYDGEHYRIGDVSQTVEKPISYEEAMRALAKKLQKPTCENALDDI